MLASSLCSRLLVAGARSASPLLSALRLQPTQRAASGPPKDTGGPQQAFDPALLDVLVCPLSRKPLRYEEATNELINEELGIAYPIIDGIPNMIPQDARKIQREKTQPESE